MRAMLDYEPSETRREFERGDIVRILDTERFPPLSMSVKCGDRGVVEGVTEGGKVKVLIAGRNPTGGQWLRQFVNPSALEHTDALA